MIRHPGLAEPVVVFVTLNPFSPGDRPESVTYIPASVLAYLRDRTPEDWSDLLAGRRAEVRLGVAPRGRQS
jgi:hypothetical protein